MNTKRMEKRQKKHFTDFEAFQPPMMKLCITQTTTEMHGGVNLGIKVSTFLNTQSLKHASKLEATFDSISKSDHLNTAENIKEQGMLCGT